ncbi:MAG: transposase, partial [Clostridia bacterium]|nr:transposase [Clostridia bacterium]
MQAFIEKIPDKYPNVQIDHSVIMPNHVHLIVHIQNHDGQSGTGNPSPTVGTVMGWWKYQTTKTVREHGIPIGEKLWQRSYYDHVIRNEDDYRLIWQY